jgi:hypothetical protein
VVGSVRVLLIAEDRPAQVRLHLQRAVAARVSRKDAACTIVWRVDRGLLCEARAPKTIVVVEAPILGLD